ncbi:hypothetical protein F0562_029281 [Nyssa sinensis]|uniref:Uncharacterized protein n=1 Tax=Nyssa sinensis TaxID=561372 RepID=A0A5J5B0H3_9ASTE|nr:hypothetical protein F0562_029281 [Nyssa sinensis]
MARTAGNSQKAILAGAHSLASTAKASHTVPPVPFVQPPTQSNFLSSVDTSAPQHFGVSATAHISTPIVSVPTRPHMQGFHCYLLKKLCIPRLFWKPNQNLSSTSDSSEALL